MSPGICAACFSAAQLDRAKLVEVQLTNANLQCGRNGSSSLDFGRVLRWTIGYLICPGWNNIADPTAWAENEATRSFLILRIFLKHQNSLEVGSRSRNLRFYEKKFNFLKKVDFFESFFSMKYDGNHQKTHEKRWKTYLKWWFICIFMFFHFN